MVKFNELRIELGDCGMDDCLHIAAAVPTISTYFDNIYIKDLYIIKASDYVKNKIPSEYAYKYYKEYPGNTTKSIDTFINVSDLILADFDIRRDPVIVFIHTGGEYSSDTPCGLDKLETIGIAYNDCFISNLLINDLAKIEVNNCGCKHTCDDMSDRSAINHYLLYKRMKLSFCMGNYTDGLSDYNKLIGIKSKIFNTCRCGK